MEFEGIEIKFHTENAEFNREEVRGSIYCAAVAATLRRLADEVEHHGLHISERSVRDTNGNKIGTLRRVSFEVVS